MSAEENVTYRLHVKTVVSDKLQMYTRMTMTQLTPLSMREMEEH